MDDDDLLFDELDELVDFARESSKKTGTLDQKYDTRLDLINLILEESLPELVKIYQQMGEHWVAEVKYRGINFVCVAPDKILPKEWEDFKK